MASISDLTKKRQLESERDAIRRAISIEDDAGELQALQRVLARIEEELKNHKLVFPEVPPAPATPVLSDSHYREALPSSRIRTKGSWDEGAPKRKR